MPVWVATKASLMPRAIISEVELPPMPMALKVSSMPSTVPSRPNSGPTDPTMASHGM